VNARDEGDAMKLPRTYVAAVCLLGAWAAVAGCTVGPSFKPPTASVPDAWRGARDPRIETTAAADAFWWRGFNDPALDKLVELALHQNLSLQVAGLRIVEARAQYGVATGLQFPQKQAVVGSAQAVKIGDNLASTLNLPTSTFSIYQLGFDAGWELDFWGKYRSGVNAEAASLMASVADYEAALVALTAEVARTYVSVRTFEVLVAQARENARIQEQALDIAQSRYKNGATSELDPAQATTQLESTRASIPRYEASLEQARDALATLLGQPAGTLDGILTGPKAIPTAPARVGVGVPAEILRRRPDIRSAELNAAAQCARIGVAKADLYPSFSIVGTFGLRSGNSSVNSAPKDFFSSHSLFWVAGPSLNWPFLNYGRLTNGVRVEDARFQQLLVNYRDTVLRATQEVEDALVGFLGAQQATASEQKAVAAAQHAVDLSVIQYREGAVDFQRVIDAQRSLLQEEQSLTESSSSVVTNLIALYKALGGGWESRQGQPVITEPTQREMKDRTNWGGLLTEPRAPEAQTNPPPEKH
jgi:NodT family efflux transporter outer membrane factor (OMF) lipoprotein